MRIIKHLLEHKVAVFLVLVLLVAQAACDLALPTFTSDLVDVGISQSGVEDAACEVLTNETHDKIEGLLDGADRELFETAYEREGDRWKLSDVGRAHISELDEMMAAPLVAIYEGSAATANTGATTDETGDLFEQRAISAALAELEAAGSDVSAIQLDYLVRTGVLMALIAALGMGIAILIGFVASRTGASIGRDLRLRLFSRVVTFSEREIGHFSAASLITRGTNDIQLIQNVSIMFLRMVLFAPIMACGGIVMVMATNAELGWVVVCAIVCVFCLIAVLFKLTLPRFRVMQRLIDRVNLVAREMLTGMPVVRAFEREGYEEKRFDEASTKLMRTQLFTNRAMTFMMPTMTLIMNLTSVAIVWFGGLSVEGGSLQTGDLIAFITYAMVIIMGFLMLGMIAVMLPRANVAAERIDEVITYPASIRDPEDAPAFNPSASGARGAHIVFEDVSFCYDESITCENVLTHVSFEAKPGETVALIGATGSGKSTVLKLIERFYDVTSGRVTVDGVDVREIPQNELRAQFGYVPQKSFLFSGTIASNVAYSNPSMSEANINDAIDIAQASDLVKEKEGGLGAAISQGGTNVSGGQRQRLAIARALATGARAFLFDDSFSALDYKTDAALRSALGTRLGEVTCIIVAQRIATVMGADRIVVLDEGKVVGQGKHEELLATCDEYREIALSQLSADELSLGGEAA